MKKLFKWILFILFILLGVTIAYILYMYNSVEELVDNIHNPINRKFSNLREDELSFEKREPISLLIMGVDERKNDRGRTDSLIYLSLNPENESMKFVSIPRDTYVYIPSKDKMDKINHAYAYDGIEGTIETVEEFLDVPVDYYVKMNMKGFSDMVDTLDGITIYNEREFNFEGKSFPEGEIQLNGTTALPYVRMRYQDPEGDIGRNKRQQLVMQAMINKAIDPRVITKLDDILKVLDKNVQTNLTFDEIKELQKKYSGTRESIQREELTGEGTKINGTYFYRVSDEEQQKITTLLKEHLKLKKSKSKSL